MAKGPGKNHRKGISLIELARMFPTEDAADGSSAYRGRPNHESVAHSAGEYVRYMADGATVHTNGVESFWSMLKRAHKGTFHRLSAKHLQRVLPSFGWAAGHSGRVSA